MGILSKFPVGDSSQPFKIRAFVEGGRLSASYNTAYAVAFGDDKFVAVGSKFVSYSADGITWTEGTLPADCINATFKPIAHGIGRFVAVGYDNSGNFKASAITSTDGINWTSVTLPENKYWQGICRGPDKFVAVGWNCVATSTDGVTWTKPSSYFTDRYWEAVIYGKDKYVTVARTSSDSFSGAMYSSTGSSWSPGKNYLIDMLFEGIAYGNNRYIAVGLGKDYSDTKKAMTSTDGITWSNIVMPNGEWRAITFSDNMFVAGGSNAENDYRNFAVSLDGLEWKTLASPYNHYYGITYGNGRFVAVSSSNYSAHSI